MSEALGLKGDSKSFTTPGTKGDRNDDSLPKAFWDGRKHRSLVATTNYEATEMPDLHFACKETCRDMSAPTVQSCKKVKTHRQVPLLGREKVVWMCPWKDGHGSLKVFTDGDWANDLETITIGEHCPKTWTTNQSSPALSSCDAEYFAVVDGASRALGMQTAATKLGIEVGDLSVGDGNRSKRLRSPSPHGVVPAASVMLRSHGYRCSRPRRMGIVIKEEEPVATRMTIRRLEAAGKPRVVSWADALDEEQQVRRDRSRRGVEVCFAPRGA